MILHVFAELYKPTRSWMSSSFPVQHTSAVAGRQSPFWSVDTAGGHSACSASQHFIIHHCVHTYIVILIILKKLLDGFKHRRGMWGSNVGISL